MSEINFVKLVDLDDRFSISIPSDWSVQRLGLFQPFIIQKKINEGTALQQIELRVNVTTQEDLDSFSKNVKSSFKSSNSENSYKLTSEETFVIDGIPAKKIIFDTHQPFRKRILERDMFIIFIEGGVGWIIKFKFWRIDFNLYQTTIDSIIDSFHLHDKSRGQNAAKNIVEPIVAANENHVKVQKKNAKSEIRGWAIGLILIGAISIFVPALSRIWGFVLIATGIIEMIYPKREMFAVNGILLIIIGLWNAIPALAAGDYLWGALGIAQFGWGIQQFGVFAKYMK